jgi:hypothetical protein
MQTAEVDIYAFDAPNVEELSDLIDGSIGQDSLFHATFGYYADGVSQETSKYIDWLGDGVASGVLSLERMTARLPLMPVPDGDRGMPGLHILKDRLQHLARKP